MDIQTYGLLERPAHALVDRLQHMVLIFPIFHVDMQIHAALNGKCPEKLLGHGSVEACPGPHHLGQMIDQKRPVGQVDSHLGQRIVHGGHGKSVALNTGSIVQHLL